MQTECPFVSGRHYCVKRTFDSLTARFVAGQVLRFDEYVFSAYDGLNMFRFTDKGTGKWVNWEVPDSDKSLLNRWSDVFEPI